MKYVELKIPEEEAEALLEELEGLALTPMLARLWSNLEASLGVLDYEQGEGGSNLWGVSL